VSFEGQPREENNNLVSVGSAEQQAIAKPMGERQLYCNMPVVVVLSLLLMMQSCPAPRSVRGRPVTASACEGRNFRQKSVVRPNHSLHAACQLSSARS